MSHPSYPSYKNSGMNWAPMIPADWGLSPVKHFAKFTTGWTPPSGSAEYYGDDHFWANISDIGPKVLNQTAKGISQLALDTFSAESSKIGDLLFSFKLSIGQVSFVGSEMHTNEAIATFKKSDKFDIRWAYYAFPVFIPHNAEENIYGAPLLNQERIKNAKVFIPSALEQEKIANFLDRETTKIDTLIEKQETLIKLLAEKRSALISRAVTKGINLCAKMKDSGVERVGQVPEHWEVTRLRRVISLNPSKSELGDLDKLTKVSFLPMEAVGTDGSLCLDLVKPIAEVEDGYTYFAEGDVTIAKITPCFENFKGAVMNGLTNGCGFGTTELIVVRPKKSRITSDYLHAIFNSVRFRRLGEGGMQGAGGQKRVQDDFVRNYVAPIPPVKEQEEILNFIKTETLKLDELMLKAKKAIALLKEHRGSLISAVVTGKICIG